MFSQIMHTSQFSTEELQKSLQEELTFFRFMEMKKRWLSNIRTEWLIMGHLEEKDAIDIVTRGEKNMKSKTLDKDQIPIARLV